MVRKLCCGLAIVALAACAACGSDKPEAAAPVAAAPAHASVSDALPAERTGGFDGARAFAHLETMVGFGPRHSGSDGIRRTQEYIRGQLDGFGCKIEEDDFQANTPVGRMAMKNIVTKIPGKKAGVILLLTHYDSKRMENFVGANDPGSSAGLMLEMARLLCPKK
ncbi:MAG TPA: M28 family peptidase, partial [Candidatus Nitrosotenuis sp.]|nr:M28 family peptidase [Candidatus Nitrosotenuis sp.]